MFLINPYILQASGGSYILDTYGSAKVAYSFRKLSSTSTLSCRVRRSSDNAEQDIGFVSDELDTTSLLSFIGANDGYVTTMYDQTTNSIDVTQSTASRQMKIVSSGALVTNNSKVAAEASLDSLISSSTITASNISMLNVINITNTSSIYGRFGIYGDPLATFTAQSDFTLRYDGGSDSGVLTPTTGNKIRYSERSNTAVYDYFNSVENINNTSKSLPDVSGNVALGYASSYFAGYFHETIIWDSSLLSQRTDLETEINNYYGIY
jgi:hypothetical protein